MALPYGRSPAALHNSVNLYCAQCESQLGIFDNEWIRLTSSYARSKEKGTHFGTEVGQRTQTVPSGPAQRLAEGCVMAEVSCRKCSNLVGQYCKSVPTVEKQALAHQYFYKLSRTFLKDGRTMTRVDPVFGYGSDIVKSTNSRSSTMPRMSLPPTSRWADTPLRESSRSPAITAQDTASEARRRERVSSPMTVPAPNNERWPEAMAGMSNLQELVSSQQDFIQEQAEKLSAQTKRLDEQHAILSEQSTTVEDHESCLSAQATRIVEQEQLIENQTKRLQEQERQLSSITNQLVKLQKTMDDLKTTLIVSRLSSSIQIATPQNKTGNAQTPVSSEAMAETAPDAAKELGSLRSESHKNDQSTNQRDAESVLGKRKRNEARRSSLDPANSATIPRHNLRRSLSDTNQMPTPQSSDGGPPSPEQTPDVVATGTTRRNPHRRSRNANHRNTSPRSNTRRPRGQQNQEEVMGSLQEDQSVVDLQSSSELPSPVQVHGLCHLNHMDHVLASSALPTVKTASSVLGMNLEALIASSQALRQSLGPLMVASNRIEEINIQRDETSTGPDPIIPEAHVEEDVLETNREPAEVATHVQNDQSGLSGNPTNEVRTQTTQPQVMDLELNTNLSEEAYTDIDFVQDSVVHNLFDPSDDDDDDDLFHQDQALYGTDSLGGDTIDISAGNDPSTINPSTANTGRDDYSRSVTRASVSHQGRSMAPEPVTRQKRSRPSRTYISLDKVHIATPQMFAQANGQRAARPPAVSIREQQLNKELIQLGLSEWIGKDKTRKEYRMAVSLARARSRNLNKAAFLQSRGLKHNPMEPASTLPEEPSCDLPRPTPPGSQISTVSARGIIPPLPPSEQAAPSPPVSQAGPHEMAKSLEMAPALTPAHKRSSGRHRASAAFRKSARQSRSSAPVTQDASDFVHGSESDGEQQIHTRQARRTRANTRNTDIAPMIDADEMDRDVATEVEAKQLIGLYTSEGTRKSQRISDAASEKDEVHIDDSIQPIGENIAPQNGPENDGTNGTVRSDEQTQPDVPPNHALVRRGRGRPRKSAAPKVVNDALSETLTDTVADSQEPQAISAPPTVTNVLQDKTGMTINQAALIVSPASQARQLEEAIMLRDQMAKELMEQEGMDM